MGATAACWLPDKITLSEAHSAFGDDGSLNNERKQGSVDALAKELVDTVQKLHA